MRKTTLGTLLYIFLFLFALPFAQPALAHGGDPRLEISPERLNPGSVLDIRGVDFEFEEEVALLLVGSQMEVSLGTVLADAEGIFLLTITLPLELAEGEYVIRATTDDHVLESPNITVWGTANLGGDEDGLRQDDDGLLAPMPTYAPGVSSTPIPRAAAPVESAPANAALTPLLWIAAGMGVLLLFGLILIRGRK